MTGAGNGAGQVQEAPGRLSIPSIANDVEKGKLLILGSWESQSYPHLSESQFYPCSLLFLPVIKFPLMEILEQSWRGWSNCISKYIMCPMAIISFLILVFP